MPEVMVSKTSLFGIPIGIAMRRAKQAGFSGIEILITYRFGDDYFSRCIWKAEDLGLTVHWHQAWSADEDPTDRSFVVMEEIGYLLKSGYKLRDHIPFRIHDKIIVINADRIVFQSPILLIL